MDSQNYEYPLLPDWSVTDVIIAVDFYQAVEKLYGAGIKRVDFLHKYRLFSELEPAKMIQKQLDKRFKEVSGLSIYRGVQFVFQNDQKFISYKK